MNQAAPLRWGAAAVPASPSSRAPAMPSDSGARSYTTCGGTSDIAVGRLQRPARRGR